MHIFPTELQDAVITGIGSYVPDRRMSNDELAQFLDTSDEWIFSKTGIHNRHIAADNEATSDLGASAAQIALQDAGISPLDVDLIIVATSSPDYNGLPSTACVVQDLIGADNAAAMDVAAVCSGFVYATETARAYLRSGSAHNVLVIGAEVYSRVVDWTDRSTCVLFGDGAGAVVMQSVPAAANKSAVNSLPHGRVIDSVLKSRGRDSAALIRPAGGTRRPIPPGEDLGGDQFLQMDGRRVYNFAVGAIGYIITELLNRSGVSLDDLAWVVPHQANARILEAAARRIGYPAERMYSNIAEYANTSAASIPIAMNEMVQKGLLLPGQKIITVGFGAGLTYGGNLIELQ
ncbi:MAG: beta-ketoacyl-ACP synthase III [Spirochaeta sp.]